MPKLTAQFVGGKGLASRLIEIKGAGPYSHVDIVCPDARLLGARDNEVGGQPQGVWIRPQGYEEWDALARIHIDVSQEQYNQAWDFWNAQIGKPYDETAILGFVIGRNWQETDSWFCSELWMQGLIHANVFVHPLAVAANKIDPSTAFAISSTLGDVIHVK